MTEPREKQNKIVGIVGRRGAGKSTIMKPLLKRCPRLVVWDAMGEHDWLPNRFTELSHLAAFLNWSRTQQTFAAGYVPQADLAKDFASVCAMAYQRGDLAFAVEEVPMLCSPGALPYDFDRIVRLGRHKQVSIVWTAQRMVEVARRLTAATDLFVLFAHTEPRDLEGIAERCGSAVAGQVAQLDRHGCVTWNAVQYANETAEQLNLL